MNYLLSGSFAYDTILLHKGLFHTRILPESISRLNVAFGIDTSKREFGGTGGNIAYNSSLLKDNPVLCASVGGDFGAYEFHLEKCGVTTQTLTKHNENITAHSWILTDQSNNQITGFQKGAMGFTPNIPQEAYDCTLWHLAPDAAETTAILAKTAIEKKIKYFFDPGQALPSFLEGDVEEIYPFNQIVENACGLFLNEYESQLIQEKLGKNLSEIMNSKHEFIIETLGSKGLLLHTQKENVLIPVAKVEKIIDPTGCGDSFRAGFIYGYMRKWNLKECAELGAVMASFVIEQSGGQNHSPSFETISDRLNQSFEWQLK